MIWTGIAVLVVADDHISRQQGYIGGFAAFACEAEDLASAVANLMTEFAESALVLIGFKQLIPVHMLSRATTQDEQEMIAKLALYQVQFRDVHLHKGDA